MAIQVVNLLDSGPIPYREGWERQKALVARRQLGEIHDTLLQCEHPPHLTYRREYDHAETLLLRRTSTRRAASP